MSWGLWGLHTAADEDEPHQHLHRGLNIDHPDDDWDADTILKHVQTEGQKRGTGIGRHWTTMPEVAEGYAEYGEETEDYDAGAPNRLQVVLRGQQPKDGSGLDPNHTGRGVDPATYNQAEAEEDDPYEASERTMLPGTPMHIDQVQVRRPGQPEWTVLPMKGSGPHTASTDGIRYAHVVEADVADDLRKLAMPRSFDHNPYDYHWHPEPEADGKVTLYHRTQPDRAEAILKNQRLHPGDYWSSLLPPGEATPEDYDDDEVWFATSPEGRYPHFADTYGPAVLKVRVPADKIYWANGPRTQPGEVLHAAVYPDHLKGLPIERHASTRLAMPSRDAYDYMIMDTKKKTDDIPEGGSFYHGSNHEHQPGDILESVRARGDQNRIDYYENSVGAPNHADWVWMYNHPAPATKYHKNVYELEPLDEGPWIWNNILRDDGAFRPTENDEDFPRLVSPRARIVRKLSPDEHDAANAHLTDYYQKLREQRTARRRTAAHEHVESGDPNRPEWTGCAHPECRPDLPTTMYHSTHPKNRDSITQNGLLASYSEDDEFSDALGMPHGVYMTANIPKIGPYTQGDDVWAIDTTHLRHLENDYPKGLMARNSFCTKYDVPTHAMRLLDKEERPLCDQWAKWKEQDSRNARLAAVTQDLVDSLHGEFHDWWDQNKDDLFFPEANPHGRGPVGHWPNIESFLQDRYPAAHRGLNAGQESVMPLLDFGSRVLSPLNGREDTTAPYETGPEAVQKHGYDPKEIAAGMLLLHNRSHPHRSDLELYDTDRLVDIARKRSRMQQDYDQRNARLAAVNQDLVDRLDRQFHGWWTDTFADRHRAGAPEVKSWLDHGDHDAGPTSHWPNIEAFLKERYPAAHKGHEMGLEEAGHILDGHDPMPYQQHGGADLTPYATGPEAETTHGYDPKEIAAGMLLLHNRSHPLRGDMAQEDQDRLTDIFTKRQQMQRSYEQRNARLGAKYYHLTDQPDFKLNPEYRPENNTTMGGDWPVPGLFVSDSPATWFGGHQYHQPYVAEFDVPDEVFGHENAMSKGYLNEKFIPANAFGEIKHTRTIPYDAHVREEYGSYGPTEGSSGRDFQTGQPIDTKNRNPFPDGYQYPGPADPEWHENYQKTMDQYHRADGSEFSGGWENYQDPRIGTYAWNPEGHKAWYHPATGEYHRRPNVSFRGVEVDAELHEFSRTPWDEVGEGHDDDHHTAARLAMAWDQWADKVEQKPGSQSRRNHEPCSSGQCDYSSPRTTSYVINNSDGEVGKLEYMHNDFGGENTLNIEYIKTYPNYLRSGVAEALMRRLVEDHPGIKIHPGPMSSDGQGFHDKMLDKEPSHRGLLATGDA